MLDRATFLAAALLFAPAVACAATLRVDPLGPIATVQAGIDSAATGDTLLLAPGVYRENALVLRKDLVLLGRAPGLTILDGGRNGYPALWTWSSRVHCEDLVLQNGTAPYGAGVLEFGGRVELVRCDLLDSQVGAFSYRGTVNQGELDLEDCTALRNGVGVEGSISTRMVRVRLEGNGLGMRTSGIIDLTDLVVVGNGKVPGLDTGGMALGNSEGKVRNCEVRGNSSAIDISGIRLSRGPFEVSDCRIVDNVASGGSAGVGIDRTQDALLVRCTISGNVSRGSVDACGGLVVARSHVRLQDCVIERNASQSPGGGVSLRSGAGLDMLRGRIVQNSTLGQSGGGVSLSDASATLQEVVVAGNSAPTGGGIAADARSTLSLVRTTVAANASQFAAALFSLGARVTVERSLLAFHQGAAAVYCQGNTTFQCSDLFGNGSGALCGTDLGGNVTIDPLFCGLVPENLNYDVRLRADSPVAGGSGACGLMGALAAGCETTGVQPVTWSVFKALYRSGAAETRR